MTKDEEKQLKLPVHIFGKLRDHIFVLLVCELLKILFYHEMRDDLCCNIICERDRSCNTLVVYSILACRLEKLYIMSDTVCLVHFICARNYNISVICMLVLCIVSLSFVEYISRRPWLSSFEPCSSSLS